MLRNKGDVRWRSRRRNGCKSEGNGVIQVPGREINDLDEDRKASYLFLSSFVQVSNQGGGYVFSFARRPAPVENYKVSSHHHLLCTEETKQQVQKKTFFGQKATEGVAGQRSSLSESVQTKAGRPVLVEYVLHYDWKPQSWASAESKGMKFTSTWCIRLKHVIRFSIQRGYRPQEDQKNRNQRLKLLI